MSATQGPAGGSSVLLYSPVTLRSRHHMALLDVALAHLDAGDQVTVLECDGDLLNCPPNPAHSEDRCRECRLQADHSISRILGARVRRIVLDLEFRHDLPAPRGIGDLAEFRHDGVPIGRYAARELINELKDVPDESFEERERLRASVLLRNAVALFDAGKRLFRAEAFDRVVVTNGRHDSDGPLAEAARLLGIPTDAIEGHRGDVRVLRIADAASVHDFGHRAARTEAAMRLTMGGDPRPSIAGHRFFTELRAGRLTMRDWVRFHRGDEPPPDIEPEPDRDLLAIYSHSDWEYWGMSEHALFDEEPGAETVDQYTRIERLLGSAAIRSRFTVVVRWHPNLAAAGPRIRARRCELEARFESDPGVHFIQPEDRVSSYALLDRSRAVVTFGSTIGIEATYWGRTSILYGVSPYEASGCYHVARTLEEAERVLTDPGLGPNPQETALAVAWVVQDLDLPPVQHFERASDGWRHTASGTALLSPSPWWVRLRRRVGDSNPRGR